MTISFDSVPSGIRVPWLYAEFNNAGAVQGPANQPYKTTLIGPRLATGTKAEKTKHLVTSYEQAKEYFGVGSLIAEMAKFYLDNNKVNELHCISLDDNAAGVASTGALLFGGAPTKAGTINLYIAGEKIQVGVEAGEALADIASNVNDAIAAKTNALVSSAINGVTTEQLDLTAKNDGLIGNEIDLRYNYQDDEELPEGLTLTITAMSGGATNPDITDALATLDDTQYISFISAFTDAANLTVMESYLADKFGPLFQNDGYAHYGVQGTLSELNAIGDARNSQFTVFHRASGPNHPAVQAAGICGVIAFNGSIDPARPFQTLTVKSIMPERDSEKLDLTERNILLNHGISTNITRDDVTVQIERVITTYKTSPAGAADVSYLNLNTLLTLSYIRYDWRNYMLQKYPRHKLANDGTRFAQGQPIMTPKLGKAEAVRKFSEWEFNGLVEGIEQYKEDLIVERNVSDVDRLDFLLPPDLINQLRVMGTQIAFLL